MRSMQSVVEIVSVGSARFNKRTTQPEDNYMILQGLQVGLPGRGTWSRTRFYLFFRGPDFNALQVLDDECVGDSLVEGC